MIVEAFNKILESTLTRVCNAQRNDWDMRVPAVLWAYRMTCKKLTEQMSFRIVYGVEVVMLMEYILPVMAYIYLRLRKAGSRVTSNHA